MATRKSKPKLAVWKFASCDGCQLSLLACDEDFLRLTEFVELADFKEASSQMRRGPYQISLVEGSITTPEQQEEIIAIRKKSHYLVTIGACATSGGIQALRNFADVKTYAAQVYAHPQYIRTLDQSTPISAYVKVDYELHGCPVDKRQLLEVISAYLQDRRPRIPDESVCSECKLRGTSCILVADKAPCLGPITRSGCGAICPSYRRACYGCFAPKENSNINAFIELLRSQGVSEVEIANLAKTYNAWHPALRDMASL